MQYVVNGVVFDDLNEANAYENELKEKKRKEQDSLNEYKTSVLSKLKVFKLSTRNKTVYIATIVDSEHYKFATAIAEQIVGRHFDIEGKTLVTNWTLSNAEKDVFDDILNSIVYKKPSSYTNLCIFQGVDIERPAETEDLCSASYTVHPKPVTINDIFNSFGWV